MDIYTIGHSTHTQDEFIFILKSHQIETLIDIRSYPGSRRLPHFNKEVMEQWIPQNGIRYLHMPELGGRRRKLHEIDESLINGWDHISFRNYAAYTLTSKYEQGIDKLMTLSEMNKVAFMCSEILHWKCHRSIVSNTLTAKGVNVYHIMSETKLDKHVLGRYGAKPKISNNRIIYPKQEVVQMEFQLV